MRCSLVALLFNHGKCFGIESRSLVLQRFINNIQLNKKTLRIEEKNLALIRPENQIIRRPFQIWQILSQTC